MVGDKEVPERYRQRISTLIRCNDREEINANIAKEIEQ